MKPVTIAVEEQLLVRKLQVEVLIAQNQAHDFRAKAEQQVQQLAQTVQIKELALKTTCESLAKKYGFVTGNNTFNFDTMTIAPTDAVALGTPDPLPPPIPTELG